MIPRTLVPRDVRPVAADGASNSAPRRLSSTLDSRTIIPRDLPVRPIDAKSAIPEHVPFDVIVGRALIERTWHVDPRDDAEARAGATSQTALDARTVVPSVVEAPTAEDRAALQHLPELTADLLEVVEPDILVTGDVNLLIRPVETRDAKWNAIARASSIAFHVALILLVISSPKLFERREPTADELALARKELSFVYIPRNDIPRTPRPPAPAIHVDPNILRRIAPPAEIPSPPPSPTPSPKPAETAPSVKELPEAVTPRTAPPSAPPSQPPSPVTPLNPSQTVPPAKKLNLNIPKESPGKVLEDTVQDALRRGQGGAARGVEGRIPNEQGGGGGGGTGNEAVQILTPTQGVDFSSYLDRLLATVRRNWYAVIPESARLGDKGIVVLQFKINQDGSVPFEDPRLERTSGKEPLDRAAVSSIHASNPFEPLPPAFKGRSIELRFAFFYNLPVDSLQ